MTAPFRNDHLSYSRLSRYQQCPLSYRLQYIEKRRGEPGPPLVFGSLIHAVLETLVREVVDDERTGPLSQDRALDLYRDAWAKSGLADNGLFEEGFAILKNFVRDQGVLDHRDVLAIEKEFRLPVGPFTVLGFMDRVDRLGDDGIEVIDFKTNRMLFSRDELDQSLQMSIYAAAAQRLWPWAKNVRLTFHMLRHGLRQVTERTPEQLEAALAYVETLGRQTEETTEFPARLNTNCVWCDHKQHCPAYAEALQGKRDFVCEDLGDLEAVAREREEVARLAKILYARKAELEGVLKSHLEDKDELVLCGVRYRMFRATSVDYPLEATVRTLADASGLDRETLIARLGCVDKKSLDGLIKELAKPLGKPRVTLLKAELEAGAETSYTARFWAKEIPGGSDAQD